MRYYHKIQSIYKRYHSDAGKELRGKFIEGKYSRSEFKFLRNCEWEFTEKLDGMNTRIIYTPEISQLQNKQIMVNDLILTGKTDNAQIPNGLMEFVEKKFNRDFFKQNFENVKSEMILFGEGIGPKIQKGGGNYSKSQIFVLFDINIDGIWLEHESVEEIAARLDIYSSDVIGYGTLDDMVELCKNGFKSEYGDFDAEGIVARCVPNLIDRRGHRIITKCKLKDFR